MAFDLLTQPWLPVVYRDGTHDEIGVTRLFQHAHRIYRLAGETPPMTAALYRLILAIAHRAYGPATSAEWRKLRDATTLPAQSLTAYLNQWRSRFDLFDHDRPFLQCPGLSALPPASVSKLVPYRATGNNVTLFDHTTSSDHLTLDPSDAARWLVTTLTYDPGGTKTPYERDKSSEAAACNRFGVTLIESDTLKETLLLNMLIYDTSSEKPAMTTPHDRPSWEDPEPPNPLPHRRTPAGWTDLLTWPTRRILLNTGNTDGHTVVDGVVITPGTRLDGELVDVEMMAAFRRPKQNGKPKLKAPLVPVRLVESRGVWRHSIELLLAGTRDRQRPRALDQLADRVEAGHISADTVYTLRVFGQQLDDKRTVVQSWSEEQVPIPVALLRADSEAIGAILGYVITLADDVGDALRFMTTGYRAEFAAAATDTVDLMYWPHLPPLFARFLRALAEAHNSGQSESRAVDAWATAIRTQARAAADQWVHSSPRQGRALLAAGKHHTRLTGRVHQLIQLFQAHTAAFITWEDSA